MDYHEVTVKIPSKDVDTASAIANMVVPYGIYIEDYSDLEEVAPQIAHVDLIEQELLERDREHALIHVYIPPEASPKEAISFLEERLKASQIPYTISQGSVREEDWATAWKKYYFPTKIGERLVVVPSWETYGPKTGEIPLVMDPGMAFGTGTHDTTQLCMRFLEQIVKSGDRLLDIGTGSGILAITAILLGAGSALGVDIDEVAIRVAGENAQLNGVSESVQFVKGDLTTGVNGKFSLITANIVADVIIRLIPDLDAFLDRGGRFVASGIIDSREADVTSALEENGFEVIRRMESGGWSALLAQKKAGA